MVTTKFLCLRLAVKGDMLPGRGYRGIHKQLPIFEFDDCHADGSGNIEASQSMLLFEAPNGARLHLSIIIPLTELCCSLNC